MHKVVVDTNVFVSSFFGGNPRKIIDCWKNSEITLCLSQTIVDEYVAVLQRLKFNRELDELLDVFASGFNTIYTHKTPSLNIIEDDPDDDKFIECAVALKADFIISGDKHLLNVGQYFSIGIVNPKDYLAMRESED